MKKILLLLITALVAVSTSLSLEPMKVGFVYTGAAPVDVHVQLADNNNNAIFVGETFTGLTPNNSGVIVVNVLDDLGTDWADFQPSDVSTYNTIDIYTGTTLYAQYRLDALILNQAQNGILDQDGNLVPAENKKGSIGTDELRWKDAFVSGSTLHVGPENGVLNSEELAIGYNESNNKAEIRVDGSLIIEASDEAVTIDGITVGQGAGNNGTNTAVGLGALKDNTIGTSLTAIGLNALGSNTEGKYNTANGEGALFKNTTGEDNTAIGQLALYNNTEGNKNTAIGRFTLYKNTEGEYNTATGTAALFNNIDGDYNTATGRASLYINTTGTNNTATGNEALRNNTEGNYNTATGQVALYNNTEGDYNTATGRASLYINTTGTNNTAIGSEALRNNTEGNYNTVIGNSALYNNSEGDYNTAAGSSAGNSLTSGSNNTFVGSNAGNNGSQLATVSNSTAIGNGAFTTASNQVVIGNGSITETNLRGATLVDLAGGGTQNIQVDNTGKLVAAGVNGGGTAVGDGTTFLTINNANIIPTSAITLTIESFGFYDYSILTISPGNFTIHLNSAFSDIVHYTFVNP